MKKRIVQALSVFVIALVAFAGFFVGGDKPVAEVARAETATPTEGLEIVAYSDHCVLYGRGGATENDIVIPATYEGLPVTEISGFAFFVDEEVTSIAIPETVEYIPNGAFYACDNLKSITVSEGNPYYKSVDGNVYSKDGDYFVRYAVGKRAEEFSIPDGVETVYEDAFQEAMYLHSIHIPASVTYIQSKAFSDCENVTTYTVASGNSHYRAIEGNLYNKSGTTLVQYAIGKEASSFTIGESVESLDIGAFWYAGNLKSIHISKNLFWINEGEFFGCYKLEKFTVDKNNEYFKAIDGNLYTKDGKKLLRYAIGKENKTFVVPDGVTAIGKSAVSWGYYLEKVLLPDGLKTIGEEGFYSCSHLKSVIIPDAVTTIGESAFGHCEEMRTVVLGSEVAAIEEFAFSDCEKLSQVFNNSSYLTVQKGSQENGWVGYYATDIHNNFTKEDLPESVFTHSIAVLSTEKSLTIEKGGSLKLGFGYIDNETQLLEGNWRQMALAVSDPSVISLGNYEETDYGYAIEVTGLKKGSSHLTVTDTVSGLSTVVTLTVQTLFNRSYSYEINNLPIFYPNNSWENEIQTNFYNLNGMYVNGYSCEREGSKYKISFNVYNSKYHIGAVDIYDKNGNWIGCEEISKFTSMTSLWETGEQAFHLVSDWVNKRLLTYEQASYAKKTEVSFEVPVDGYFTISNNIKASPGMFLYNFSEMLFEGITSLLGKGDKDGAREEFSDSILKEIKNKPKVKKLFLDCFNNSVEDEIKDFGKNLANKSVEEGCIGITELFKDLLDAMDITWEHFFESATGIGQSIFEAVSGPAGVALKGCFAFNEAGDKYLRLLHLVGALDEPYIGVYSKLDEGFITQNGVVVNTNGNMDVEAVLQTFKISNDDSLTAVLNGNPLQDYQVYNISFVKNDQTVQPSGKVQVQIPIPKGMKGNTCKVYRKEEDGSWTMLQATVQGNYLVFETEHFSLYGVVGEIASLRVESLPNRLIYQVGDALDTEGLTLSLNGEEITEGYVCEQRVLHTVGEQTVTVKYGLTTAEFTVIVTEKAEIPPTQPSVKPTEPPSADGSAGAPSESANSADGADEKKGGCGCGSGISTALGTLAVLTVCAGVGAFARKRKE